MSKCIFRRGVGCYHDSIVTTRAAAMQKAHQWRKRSKDGYFWGVVLTDCDPESGIATDAERPDVTFNMTTEEVMLLKGVHA